MAKSEGAHNTPSEKKPRKVIQPDSSKSGTTDSDVSDAELDKINASIKAMDSSLEPDKVTKVEDNGNDMPKLVSSDGENLEDGEDDILAGDMEVLSDEVVEKIEEAEAEDHAEETKQTEDDTEEAKKQDEDKHEDNSEEIPEEQEDDNQVEDKPTKKSKKKPADDDGIPDDPVIDQAVKEIMTEESDAILAAEDASHSPDSTIKSDKKRKKSTGLLALIFPKKRILKILLGLIVIGLFAVAFIPKYRYFALNTVGIRSGLELRIIDGGTLQPIKNVSVRAGGADGLTDEDGVAKLHGVRLGKTILQIDKRAFAPIEQSITVGWGSNPLGEFQVEAVGTQYTVKLTDYLSGNPIAKAQASSGDGNATSDEEGVFVITLDTVELDDSAEIVIDIAADSYRNEQLTIPVNNRESQEVKMVPARKHVYVSKRSGKYDVYTAYIDGKEEQKIVGGSGIERDDIALVPHQGTPFAAFVATRENARNSSGYLLSTLYIIETDSGNITKIDQSEKIQLIGWSTNGRLVYVKVAAGASGTDPKRHRLMSFDSNDFAGFKELAASNAFNDVLMAKDKIYYAPSNIFQENPEPGVFAIKPSGDEKQRLFDKETFSLLRSDYNTLFLSTGNDWYKYSLKDGGGITQAESPSSQVGRVYQDNPSAKQSVWVDERDGKGTLQLYNSESGEESTLISRSGLRLPVYWLDEEHIIFRVFDGTESADYVTSVSGGDDMKIADVSNTSGISRWYYY